VTLAALYHTHRDALLADMWQTYGIDVRCIEEEGCDVDFVAALASQLPRGSRVWKALDPDAEWTMAEWLLSNIDHGLRMFFYGLSKEAKLGIGEPEAVLPTVKEKGKESNANGVAAMEIDKLRGIIEANVRGE